jgi:extracellular elastinolytic metalloproteinase
MTARPSDTATTARGMGNYVVFQGPNGVGIRPTQYTTNMTVNPATYQDVIDDAGTTLSIPHGVGYVWASTIWEVYWNLVDAHGFNPNIYDSWDTGGNNLALQLVIDGMKFQPCHPGFVQGRDGILDADLALTGGDNQCLIWEGFAKRGVGFSADQGSSRRTNDGIAAFDLPPECTSAGTVLPIGLTGLAAAGLEVARRQLRRRRLSGTYARLR